MRIDLARDLQKQLRNLDGSSLRRVNAALDQLASVWGNPHLHAGIAIRKLSNGYFECRCGLQLRLLFRTLSDTLYVVFIGNHDEIRRLIKTSR